MLFGVFRYSDDRSLIIARCSSVLLSDREISTFSVDVFSKNGSDEAHKGSFRGKVIQTGEARVYAGRIEKSSLPGVHPIHSFNISEADSKIHVVVSDSTNAVVFEFNASKQTEKLRKIHIVYEKQNNLDEQSKIEEVKSIDLRNYLTHTLKSALDAVSIEFSVTAPSNQLDDSLIGDDNIWSSTELLSAIRTREQDLRRNGKWAIWLFEGSAYDRTGVLGTLISSSADPFFRRRGCAVFTGLIEGVKQDRDRIRLRTAVHEIGHCLNLVHTVVRPPENGHMNFYDASVRDQYSSSTSAGVL